MADQHLLCIVIGIFLQLGGNRANEYKCGTAEILIPRISRGNSTIRGEWPFLAALYHVERMDFFCGGTLISKNHVLTAAHCVHIKDSSQEFQPDDIVVILGGYNLLLTVEKGSVPKDVNEIHVHPEWKVYSPKYDADIAILSLRDSVTFSYFIRPVCLPTDDSVIEDVRGAIVGWGLDDNGMMHLAYPKHASTIIRNQSYCLTTDPELAYLSSTRTFCANGGDGVPQQGDSGGGFFALSGSSWVQYGIISALRINATGVYDLSSFALYTNVKLFKSWIDDIVGRTQEEVETLDDFGAQQTELFCRYDVDDELGYTCRILGFDIQSENFRVTSIAGDHFSGKTDSDVQNIFFWDAPLHYLPNGLGSIFRNLKSVVIGHSLGLKVVKPSSLKNMENLVSLVIESNELMNLDADALWSLKNLEKLHIKENRITAVDRKLLEKNRKLTEINLNLNKIETIDDKALLFLSNLRKFSIFGNKIQKIFQSTFEGNPQLTEIDLSVNEISFFYESTLWNLKNLEKFSISSNQIQKIFQSTFEGNPQLTEINLGSNEISFFYERTLWNLKNLEKFDASGNRLTHLDARFFEKNTQLKVVALEGNQIEILDERLFINNLLLEEAVFRWNKLREIRPDFTKLKNIRWLTFVGNRCVDVYLFDSPALSDEKLADFQSILRKNCTPETSRLAQ